jgi:ligand-binding SRPBCC domain-containing protein
MIHHAQFDQWVPAPVDCVFLFFANPENLPRIMPPETGTRLVRRNLVSPPGDRIGSVDRASLAGIGSEIVTSFRVIPFLPFRVRWTARIAEFEWNHHFADVQQDGPFKSFYHRHEFAAQSRDGVNGTLVRDQVDYEVGFGCLGGLVQRVFVGPPLRRTFEYRQKALLHLLGSTTTAVP